MNYQTIREAILDAIDSQGPYHLWDSDEDTANESRLDFCDQVIARLKRVQLSPEDEAKLASVTISEKFDHALYGEIVRARKHLS